MGAGIDAFRGERADIEKSARALCNTNEFESHHSKLSMWDLLAEGRERAERAGADGPAMPEMKLCHFACNADARGNPKRQP